MAPDLNSLPPSRPSSTTGSPLSQRPRRISLNNVDISRPSPPSPRSPSMSSLQAAATINAGLQRPHLEQSHRRSSLMNNFSLNDPTIPGPGEMQLSNGSASGSPNSGRRSFLINTAGVHHQRQPSLGELHQELENEQEAQVNRLLQMIRVQQDQLANMQRQQHQRQDSSTLIAEQDAIPTPASISPSHSISIPSSNLRRTISSSRRSSPQLWRSESNNGGTSPGLHPPTGSTPSFDETLPARSRDECAYYQAETQMLTRENQMLKHRIRELELQIADMSASPPMGQSSSNPVSASSPLASESMTFGGPTAADIDSVTKTEDHLA